MVFVWFSYDFAVEDGDVLQARRAQAHPDPIFSPLPRLPCAMAASNFSRWAEDRNDRAALLDVERKAEEFKHQLQTTVQSDLWMGF